MVREPLPLPLSPLASLAPALQTLSTQITSQFAKRRHVCLILYGHVGTGKTHLLEDLIPTLMLHLQPALLHAVQSAAEQGLTPGTVPFKPPSPEDGESKFVARTRQTVQNAQASTMDTLPALGPQGSLLQVPPPPRPASAPPDLDRTPIKAKRQPGPLRSPWGPKSVNRSPTKLLSPGTHPRPRSAAGMSGAWQHPRLVGSRGLPQKGLQVLWCGCVVECVDADTGPRLTCNLEDSMAMVYSTPAEAEPSRRRTHLSPLYKGGRDGQEGSTALRGSSR